MYVEPYIGTAFCAMAPTDGLEYRSPGARQFVQAAAWGVAYEAARQTVGASPEVCYASGCVAAALAHHESGAVYNRTLNREVGSGVFQYNVGAKARWAEGGDARKLRAACGVELAENVDDLGDPMRGPGQVLVGAYWYGCVGAAAGMAAAAGGATRELLIQRPGAALERHALTPAEACAVAVVLYHGGPAYWERFVAGTPLFSTGAVKRADKALQRRGWSSC